VKSRGSRPAQGKSSRHYDHARSNLLLNHAERIGLSPRELMLLKVLMLEPGRVFTHTELCERVWEHAHEYDTQLVKVFIGRLRRKIGDPPLVHTVRHVAYTICGSS
jgi:DNA-binding response OmpR family regulator